MLDKTTIDKANYILAHLASYTTLENEYPFVECATFADESKSVGWIDQAEMHYVDTPFFDDGYKPFETSKEDMNATWAIVNNKLFIEFYYSIL